MRSNGRPVITEAKLRRIIRDELVRQHLIEEGILDTLAKPFKKLGDKAKKTIMEKTDEVMEKIKPALEKLKDIGSAKDFLKSYQTQEGAVPVDELLSQMGVEDLLSKAKEVESIDFQTMAKKSSSKGVAEGTSVHDLRMSLILIEEEYNQKYGQQEIINESVAAVLGAWWGLSKASHLSVEQLSSY